MDATAVLAAARNGVLAVQKAVASAHASFANPAAAYALAVGGLCVGLFLIALIQTRKVEAREDAFIKQLRCVLKERSAAAPRSAPLTALVTGANSGIGFVLAQVLAEAGVHVTLGCRDPKRGADAVERLRARVPGARASLLLIDVADPASTTAAAAQLASDPTYGVCVPGGRLDFLLLNAGIMPIESYRWSVPALAFLTGGLTHFFETSRAGPLGSSFLKQPVDDVGACGAPSMLATHVLGHTLLVRLLAPVLAPVGGRGGRVVWTGSRSAAYKQLDWEQLAPPTVGGDGLSGLQRSIAARTTPRNDTYGQAKVMQDLVNAGLVSLDRTPFPCVVICPGFVDTEMCPIFFKASVPFFQYIRAFTPGFNITGSRGTAAHLAALLLPPSSFSPYEKYVLQGGAVVPATNGVFFTPATRASGEADAAIARAHTLVNDWLALWTVWTGAVAGAGAAARPSASASTPSRASAGAAGGAGRASPKSRAGSASKGRGSPAATKSPLPSPSSSRARGASPSAGRSASKQSTTMLLLSMEAAAGGRSMTASAV